MPRTVLTPLIAPWAFWARAVLTRHYLRSALGMNCFPSRASLLSRAGPSAGVVGAR